MARYDFTTPRLFVDAPLAAGEEIVLDAGPTNYLKNVLRLGEGAPVQVFNGRDGEWRAAIRRVQKKRTTLSLAGRLREQEPLPPVTYAFAPLKQARLDYLVQKAVEMGAGALAPVLTQHTQVSRLNLDRVRANVVEACEQCGVIAVPSVHEPATLDRFLARWTDENGGRPLVVCDEGAPLASPLVALAMLSPGPVGVLVGPEGGFSEPEREALRGDGAVHAISLGPRILRADTAAVAVLALVQATLGDWR